MISILVAYANNGVIGSNNDLPWYLPADLKRFKELTTGHPVVMGRKTFDSITRRLGKPLPNRHNIVLTRDTNYVYPDVTVVGSITDALKAAGDDEAFIIGGAQVYDLALPLANKLYATEVQADVDGDVRFPELKWGEWVEMSRESHPADDKNQYNFDFVVYERR